VNKTLPAIALLALAAVLAIAGCGSSSSSSGGAYGSGGESAASTQSTTSSSTGRSYGGAASSTSTGAGAAVLSVGSAAGVGQVLVDSKGMTLYYFEKDKKGGGKSACSGSCASVWPPLTTSVRAVGETPGAEASQLGTIKRSDGTTQVTYAGWPLYTYTADTKAGEASGTDVKSFGGSWYPLHSNGEKAGS
jgi:predicted lipoprotein with Yx(FWY)xxD motif